MKRRGRMLAPVAVILFTCSAVAALQEQRGTDPSLPYRTRESLRWLLTLKGTPGEQRYAFVEHVLTGRPTSSRYQT